MRGPKFGLGYHLLLGLVVLGLMPTNLSYISLKKTKTDYLLRVDLNSPDPYWCPGIMGDFKKSSEETNDIVFFCEPQVDEEGQRVKKNLTDSTQYWERHVILTPGRWTFTVIFQKDGKVVTRSSVTKEVK